VRGRTRVHPRAWSNPARATGQETNRQSLTKSAQTPYPSHENSPMQGYSRFLL
jgi:hypothetical protein